MLFKQATPSNIARTCENLNMQTYKPEVNLASGARMEKIPEHKIL